MAERYGLYCTESGGFFDVGYRTYDEAMQALMEPHNAEEAAEGCVEILLECPDHDEQVAYSCEICEEEELESEEED